jgi:cell division protein FtsN
MQKKVFLQRGLRQVGGGHSPLKYLVFAVVALILLLLVTQHLFRPKGREVTRRLIPEKASVMKELPKPPEPALSETPPETARNSEPAPEPAQPPEQSGMTARAPALEAPPAAPQAEKAPATMAKPAEPPALFPKPGSPAGTSASQKPAQVQPPAQGQQKTAKADMTASAPTTAKKGQKPDNAELLSGAQPPPAMKTAAGKQLYAVQVGCFREKQNAEEIQRNLRKRGYDVILCPSAASTGGSYAYTVMTKPVDNIRKAATVVEQIKNEQKVSPTIIKMPPVCDMGGGGKQPPRKQPVPNAQAPQAAAGQ